MVFVLIVIALLMSNNGGGCGAAHYGRATRMSPEEKALIHERDMKNLEMTNLGYGILDTEITRVKCYDYTPTPIEPRRIELGNW
jgi:hypothetical protein